MTKPDALVNPDISAALEPVPIPLINEVDDDNDHQLVYPDGSRFEYAPQLVWRHPRSLEQRALLPPAKHSLPCIALDACSLNPTPSTSSTPEAPIRRTDVSGSAYNASGCLLYARDHIFECNASCSCASNCLNRVVGRGVALPLQIFKTIGRR